MWMCSITDTLLAGLCSTRLPGTSAHHEWSSVLVALLIAALLVVGLIAVQAVSSRIQRRWTRGRHRVPDGKLEH